MEQLWRMAVENAGIIFMGFGLLTMILLAVTLHRISKNEKQTKKLTETVESILLQVKDSAESEERENEETEPKAVSSIKETLQPEELLNEVLGEVFPETALR